MTNGIVVAGGGQIGEMITTLLTANGHYEVTVADRDEAALETFAKMPGVRTVCLDASDPAQVASALDGQFAVVSAVPYNITKYIAEGARNAGVHYLDLTEDIAQKEAVAALADGADTAFIPQCGLAPGFISIVGHSLATRFDQLDTLHLRVGALPQYPSNALSYNLTWSTEGVINEYCRPCEAIVGGKHTSVPALEEVERFALDGIGYEAFNTSGGLGTLCETLNGKVRSLNYRTIRYPGHRDIMKTLLQDLRLADRPDLLKEVLENAIPATQQDVVVIFASATGTRQGRLMQESYVNKIYACEIGGKTWTGIQITTSSSVCAVIDLLRTGQIPTRGFVRQEEIGLEAFLANPFGKVFAPSAHQEALTAILQ